MAVKIRSSGSMSPISQGFQGLSFFLQPLLHRSDHTPAESFLLSVVNNILSLNHSRSHIYALFYHIRMSPNLSTVVDKTKSEEVLDSRLMPLVSEDITTVCVGFDLKTLLVSKTNHLCCVWLVAHLLPQSRRSSFSSRQ